MTIFHHHMLEEQVRQHRREIEAVNREAWKWGGRKTGDRVLSGSALLLLLTLMRGF